ncbi:MAG: class I SAM-dependent methyltransferase, partial [Myxococcota bacterium]|nr:class I SAM-dependent methyltransferase [Myxococcota bacterium]
PETYYYSERALEDPNDIRALIAEHFGLSAGERAADIGCGTGQVTAELARVLGPTGVVYATDIDAGALERTRANLARSVTGPAAPIETLLATMRRDTGLEAVADGAIQLMLMINSARFEKAEPAEEARAYLARFLRKLAPGGRLIYHYDWLDPDRLNRAEHEALFISAGFDPEVGTIPMPAHIPEESFVVTMGREKRTKTPLTRGFIAVFKRPTTPSSPGEGR